MELGEDDGSLDWLLKHSLLMRRRSGWAYNKDMQLRPMLKLGCLAMQPVHVCTRSSGTPLLDGETPGATHTSHLLLHPFLRVHVCLPHI